MLKSVICFCSWSMIISFATSVSVSVSVFSCLSFGYYFIYLLSCFFLIFWIRIFWGFRFLKRVNRWFRWSRSIAFCLFRQVHHVTRLSVCCACCVFSSGLILSFFLVTCLWLQGFFYLEDRIHLFPLFFLLSEF